MGHIGYGPAAEAIRAESGLPYATGADDPDVRHPPAGQGDRDDRRDFSLQQLHEGITGMRRDNPGTQPETRPAA